MGGCDESPEQWVRMVRLAEEFRVVLGRDIERVVREFDHLDEAVIRRGSRENKPGGGVLFPEVIVEFIPVAVAFVDDVGAATDWILRT